MIWFFAKRIFRTLFVWVTAPLWIPALLAIFVIGLVSIEIAEWWAQTMTEWKEKQ